MNKLTLAKRTQILNALIEGCGIRATARMTGASKITVARLLVNVGKACQKFHDEKVKALKSKRVQCDEIWSFVYAKQKNVPEGMEGKAGDVWTWTAIDADSKLIISWLVGNRDANCANLFIQDIATRLSNRVQMTTDGLKLYINAIDSIFANDIDYAQLVKLYGGVQGAPEKKYSPAEFIGTKVERMAGSPDPKHVSTSYVERNNLTMRMHMRRFTRLTNGYSKKIENHGYAVALHFVYYNFCKIHSSIRVTPAMEAGLTKDLMSIEDIVKLAD